MFRSIRLAALATCFGALPFVQAAVASPDPATRSAPAPADAALIAHGKYLTTAGDCAACHTAPNGPEFAGGQYMDTPFGQISTPNITPDKATGIGNYTDDQFVRVLHQGINAKGEHLYPVMPFPWYTKVTRDDALAIKAYLFSLKPVDAPRKKFALEFPFNIRAALIGWDAVFLKTGVFKPDPRLSPQINRGAYLVQGLEHCGECHNGRNMLGDTAAAQALQGGPIDKWYAPNITADPKQGIGRYSDEEVFNYLKTGHSKSMGVVVGPMAQTMHESLGKLTDDDLHDIVAYLKSTPPKENATFVQESAITGPDALGAQVYGNYCASCHQPNGRGLSGSVPALVGNGAVLAAGPQDVIRVVLGGIEAQGTYSPMPAIGVRMTNQEVAEAVNYVRQSWGNKAPSDVGPAQVAALRPMTRSVLALNAEGGGCGKVVGPLADVAGSQPVQSALHQLTLQNILYKADDVINLVHKAAPQAKQADIINALTIAYCPIVQAGQGTVPEKVEMLDEFSERLYTQINTHGQM
jgi:mono/diheme cytochrome c family protein